MDTRVCSRCGTEKPIDQFPLRNSLSHLRHTYCLDCRSEYGKGWYERNKEYQKINAKMHKQEYRQRAQEFVWKYLSSHPCVDCDENDPVVLEFDHVKGKNVAIARLVTDGSTIERIQNELALCVVRCANCHRRKTAKERGWYKGV